MRESQIIERLRRIATAPGARGLLDDVAVLEGFVVTHDTIAEGVHFLPQDPPASVGWKLVAVNLSDLAAKGATPAGALLSLTISGPGEWEQTFLGGVEAACESYRLPLLGGDTIALPPTSPRVLGLTAIGRAGSQIPDRASAQPGDSLWLVGTVGDAAAGLALLQADSKADGPAGRHLPPPDPPARRWPGAGAPRPCDDGRFRRPAARRQADGSRRAAAPSRSTSRPCRFRPRSLPSEGRTGRRACSRQPAATTMPCSPRCRPNSTRKRFLYQAGRGSAASARLSPVSQASRSPSTASRSNCRRDSVLSTRVQRSTGFPLRQWLIGLSGLVSGMALALLLR